MSSVRPIPKATNSGCGARDKGFAGGSGTGTGVGSSSSSSVVIGNLMDKFLGTSLGGSSPSPTAYSPLNDDSRDVFELKEEDVWNAEDGLDDGDTEDPRCTFAPVLGAGTGGGHVAASSDLDMDMEAGDPFDRYLRGSAHSHAHGSGSNDGKPKSRSALSMGGVSLALAKAGRLNKHKEKEKEKQVAQPEEDGQPEGTSTWAAANQSSPVDVPDWNKIYQLEPKPKPPVYSSDEEEDDGTGRKHRLHPHEIVARDYARSHARVLSFSMCEGAGRTLKGRDLREVRNSILRRTGFLE